MTYRVPPSCDPALTLSLSQYHVTILVVTFISACFSPISQSILNSFPGNFTSYSNPPPPTQKIVARPTIFQKLEYLTCNAIQGLNQTSILANLRSLMTAVFGRQLENSPCEIS